MNSTVIHVLLVEDNPGDARLIIEALADVSPLGFQVKHVERLSQAINTVNIEQTDIILLDLSLPDAHGEDTVDRIGAVAPTLPIVIITGLNDEEFALRLVRKKAQDYLVKGQSDGEVLARSIRYAIERKRMLVALSLSEARYRAIVEDQTELICRFAPDGTLTFTNETFASYIDKPAKTLIGQNFVSLFSGKDLDALATSFTSLVPENPSSTVEYRVNTSNGDDRWQQWSNRALFDKEGYFVEFQVVGRDITSRKQIEAALRTSEEKFRSIVETTNEWVWTTDCERRLIYSNRAVEKMLGYSVDELIGQEMALSVHPEDLAQFNAFWTEHTLSEQGWNGLVLRWRHKDGSYRYLESNAVPILSPSGEVVGFRGADRDITERKQAEAEQLKFELERDQTRLFKRFVGGVSHDLRTPLTGIGTSLYLPSRISEAESQLKYIHKIEVHTQQIMHIVEDLFALMSLDSGPAGLNLLPLNLNSIVEGVCARQSPSDKNHRITLDLDANLLQVMGDKAELDYVVKHLLLNAVNYTPEGGEIRISTYQHDQQAVMEIMDHGVGIQAEEIPLIFERFYRADQARSTETGGCGLGLTITKKIIDMHGGQIWVKSLFGEGSTFSVAIPLIEGNPV